MPADFELEASCLAGMLDADGCIALFRNRTHYQPTVEVCQKSKANLTILQELWGGNFIQGIPQADIEGSWHLRWTSKVDVQYILGITYKYLKFKKGQADIILRYIDEVALGSPYKINQKKAADLYAQFCEARRKHYA